MKDIIIIAAKVGLGVILGGIIIGYAVFGDQVTSKTETQINNWITTQSGIN